MEKKLLPIEKDNVDTLKCTRELVKELIDKLDAEKLHVVRLFLEHYAN